MCRTEAAATPQHQTRPKSDERRQRSEDLDLEAGTTDQAMPDLSGEALARHILRLRPDLPIILCTGFSHALTEENWRSAGVRAVLMTPVARRHLCMTVHGLLAERPYKRARLARAARPLQDIPE